MKRDLGYILSTNSVWTQFKKDKVALIALLFIGIGFVVSILGYLITPDSTPNANRQLLELSNSTPGFSVDILLRRKNSSSNKVGVFSKMLFGEESDFEFIPIQSYSFKGNFVFYKPYNNRYDRIVVEKKLNLADVLYAVNIPKALITEPGERISFQEIGETNRSVESISELRDKISNNNIINQTYWLGTDPVGRDYLSRLILGTRIAFFVGFVAVFISLFLGLLLGSLAGYYRGVIDNIIVWFFNVVWAVPTILLVVAISLALGRGFWQMFIAVGLTMWVEVARVIRGQFIAIREEKFIEAGRALGFSNTRLIFKHIFPNVLGSVVVISASNFSSAILIEAGLSFLGIGAQPPTPSWGEMISSHRMYMISDHAYLAFLPGLAIACVVMAFVLISNGLSDTLGKDSNTNVIV